MSASGHVGEDAKLFEAVTAVGMDLCPELGLSVPVGIKLVYGGKKVFKER
jgi:phosphoribosylformylglycinamidine synthase